MLSHTDRLRLGQPAWTGVCPAHARPPRATSSAQAAAEWTEAKSSFRASSRQHVHQSPRQACVCSRGVGTRAQALSWVPRSRLAKLAKPSVSLSGLCPGPGHCHLFPGRPRPPPH